MKRSEMVTTLAIEMMSRLPEWEKQERINFASELLQACEIEGMLPPKRIANPGDIIGSGFTQGFLDVHEISVNKWEPEDE